MNKKGFTLVELLTVIAILGILVVLVAPNVISSFNKANDNAAKIQENQILDGAKLMIEDYCVHPISGNSCNAVSFQTSSSSKYSCLSDIQELGYIEDIVFNGNYCSGFVTYSKIANSRNFENYKTYIRCGNAYETDGISSFKDNTGMSLVDKCVSSISEAGSIDDEVEPTTPDPVEPDASTTLSFGSCSAGPELYATCYTNEVSVPSAYSNPSKIRITWNTAHIQPSTNGNLMVSAQYQTSDGDSWKYLKLIGRSSFHGGGSGVYIDGVTTYSGTITAATSKLPTNITKLRLVVHSNGTAYNNARVSLSSGSALIFK